MIDFRALYLKFRFRHGLSFETKHQIMKHFSSRLNSFRYAFSVL